MQLNDSFKNKLEVGQRIEKGVRIGLTRLLPDGYTAKVTDQDPDSPEREEYHLIDVVILQYGLPVLGIECKCTLTKLEHCWSICGWDPIYNTPLNDSSLRKYKESPFPYYLMNVQVWARRVYVCDQKTLFESRFDLGKKKKGSDVKLYNVCAEKWMTYEGDDVRLLRILTDILKREGIC